MQVEGIASAEQFSVETDPYVPITLRSHDAERTGTTFYWRAVDGDASLAEVGVSATTGRIETITLVSIEPTHVRAIDPLSSTLSVEEGIPRADLSTWRRGDEDYHDRFVDEQRRIMLELDRNGATVDWSGDAEIHRWIRTGSVLFGLTTDARLGCIRLSGLSSEQRDELETFAR